jgi:hypothetical protein
MNRDSFSRFKLSTLWTDYCAHPDRHPDGVPPPAVKRLADCYTGRRNSETLMSHVGTQTIDQVLSNQQGLETYQDFVKVESPKVGTETLLVFVALQQFKKFIDSIGIPTAEDKGEVEEKVKLMLEKSKEAINLPEALKKELEEIEGKVPTADIKGLCTIFANAEKLTNETLLQDGVFDKFLNSALYIKYRMTVMKEESLNASLEKSDALMQKRKAGAAA